MAQTLQALFGNLVLPKKNERVELYSKLGGSFLGSMRKQRPDEAKKDFLKRVKKHAARLMPHRLGFTWKCIDLEVFAHKVLVAWDDDKAKQIVLDKYKCCGLDLEDEEEEEADVGYYIQLGGDLTNKSCSGSCSVPESDDMLH